MTADQSCTGRFLRWAFCKAWMAMLLVSLAMLAAPAPSLRAQAKPDAFRVCADPNNLPFSHENREGFENRIAELFAADLGLPVEYAWFPQRMGFIRNTLRAWVPEQGRYKCDIVMGVTAGFELAATTEPYYRSTYALVYVKGRGLDGIEKAQDLLALPEEQKQSLRIGIFAHSPAVDWLLKNGLIDRAVPYQIQSGDPAAYPGQVIERDLVGGDLDLAFIWGPIAGYFAERIQDAELVVIPLESQPGIRFDYSIAMGVRYGEKEWKKTVEDLIRRNEDKIRAILTDYNVPLVDSDGKVVSAPRE